MPEQIIFPSQCDVSTPHCLIAAPRRRVLHDSLRCRGLQVPPLHLLQCRSHTAAVGASARVVVASHYTTHRPTSAAWGSRTRRSCFSPPAESSICGLFMASCRKRTEKVSEIRLTANTAVRAHHPYSVCASPWGVDVCLRGSQLLDWFLWPLFAPAPSGLTRWGSAWLSTPSHGRDETRSAVSWVPPVHDDDRPRGEHVLRTCDGTCCARTSGRSCPSVTHFMGLYGRIWVRINI